MNVDFQLSHRMTYNFIMFWNLLYHLLFSSCNFLESSDLNLLNLDSLPHFNNTPPFVEYSVMLGEI